MQTFVRNLATLALLLLSLVGGSFLVAQGAKPIVEPAAASAMQAYTQAIAGTDVSFDLVPIPAGEFVIGSPETETGRRADEGPQKTVKIDAYWMGKCEVTWNEFELWMFNLELQRRAEGVPPSETDRAADAVTRPTRPYTDMSFNMGKEGHPAICMTQLAARTYCEWVSAKSGRFYRLPTEAEWEYACRAGTPGAYSFGDDPKAIDDYAWHAGNSDGKYQKVGLKKPNAFGLYDMHGNVREWTLDQYVRDRSTVFSADAVWVNPLWPATKVYPHPARGGSYQDPPELCRSAVRFPSDKSWKKRDPQIPQSRWYFTDAQFVGFRVVRPLKEPVGEDAKKYR